MTANQQTVFSVSLLLVFIVHTVTSRADYTYGDTKILFKLIQEGEKTSREEKKRQEDAVCAVVQYCQNTIDCRRVQVLGFFGQVFQAAECGKNCSNCVEEREVVEEDVTEHAKKAISLTVALLDGSNDRITKNQCMAIFRGSKAKDLKDKGYDNLPLFGAGKQLAKEKVERLFEHLIGLRAFHQYSVQNTMGWNSMYMQVSSSS